MKMVDQETEWHGSKRKGGLETAADADSHGRAGANTRQRQTKLEDDGRQARMK